MESYCKQDYIDILKKELVPAMGCTEPIALAYAAAKAREVLGEAPKIVEAFVSPNILKRNGSRHPRNWNDWPRNCYSYRNSRRRCK